MFRHSVAPLCPDGCRTRHRFAQRIMLRGGALLRDMDASRIDCSEGHDTCWRTTRADTRGNQHLESKEIRRTHRGEPEPTRIIQLNLLKNAEGETRTPTTI